jgi:hypothetical protein
VLYDHIAEAICVAIAVFKAPQAEPILPIAVNRSSFNNEFNPVEGGIRMCLSYLTRTRSDDLISAIPWVHAMRRYSQKERRATPQYGTYPLFSSTPDHDASALTVVLDNNASALCHINASSPDESLETSPLQKDDALFVYPPADTSPSASTELLPSASATLSTATETEQDGTLSKGKATSDVDVVLPMIPPPPPLPQQWRQREPRSQHTRRQRCHRTPKHPTRAYLRYFSFHLSSTRIRVCVQDLHS